MAAKIKKLNKAVVFDVRYRLSGSELRKAIDKTLFAVSHDNLRPVMTGVLFELGDGKLRAISTDGYRLAKFTRKLKAGNKDLNKFIVPSKILIMIEAIVVDEDEVQLHFATEARRLRIEIGAIEISDSFINGTYPNYEAVIPLNNEKKMVVEKVKFVSLLESLGRFWKERNANIVRLDIEKTEVKISIPTVEGSKKYFIGSMACKFNGNFTIGFSGEFLLDAVTRIDSAQVSMEFGSPKSAVIVTSANEKKREELLMLVMPCRLDRGESPNMGEV